MNHTKTLAALMIAGTAVLSGCASTNNAPQQVSHQNQNESASYGTIESIQIQGNIRVILFDLSDFHGETKVIDQTTSDLGSFKNKAASMIIERLPQHN